MLFRSAAAFGKEDRNRPGSDGKPVDIIDHGHDIGGNLCVYGSVDIEHLTLEISDEAK